MDDADRTMAVDAPKYLASAKNSSARIRGREEPAEQGVAILGVGEDRGVIDARRVERVVASVDIGPVDRRVGQTVRTVISQAGARRWPR